MLQWRRGVLGTVGPLTVRSWKRQKGADSAEAGSSSGTDECLCTKTSMTCGGERRVEATRCMVNAHPRAWKPPLGFAAFGSSVSPSAAILRNKSLWLIEPAPSQMVASLSLWFTASLSCAFAWNYHFLSQQDMQSLHAAVVPFFTANTCFVIVIVFLLGMLIGRAFEMRGIFNLTLKDVVLETSVRVLRLLPGASAKIEQEQAKIVQQMKDKFIHDIGGPVLRELPSQGMAAPDVLHALQAWSEKETQWQDGKVSGTVYHGGSDLSQLIVKAIEMYLLSNPLHVDVFPSVRKMEAEVVSMTANLFRGPPELPLPVGTMTSGGTESIFLAMKSYRERGHSLRNITRPNMVVPVTAHAAFDKAAGLLGIELRHFAVDPITFRALPTAARACIDSNTIVVVGSAPSFAQGVIDPIQELAAAAKAVGAGCHVDCCLGSFLIAYAKRFKSLTPHDFSVDGVTSISVDTHKFGFAPKGSSVILYRDAELRRFQYFSTPRWTGGIYATATVAGSRPGALIAACWAVMAHIGDDGYHKQATAIMNATAELIDGIMTIPELRLLGNPDLSVVCFDAPKLDTLRVGDEMGKLGWSLNALQSPTCLHICLTGIHTRKGVISSLVADLRKSVRAAADGPPPKDGMGAIYGMTGSVPTSMVESLTSSFIDVLYTA